MTTTTPPAPGSSLAGAPAPGNPAFPDSPDEDVFRTDLIQGNLLVGFNKDHVMLMFLKIDQAEQARRWLRTAICPVIASADEVLAFNRLFKATRKRRSFEGTVKSTWINIALSAPGLDALVPGSAGDFKDAAFVAGMAARSETLNDPVSGDGASAHWFVGGPDREADIVLVVASDDPYDLYATVQHIEDSIFSPRDGGTDHASGVRIVFKQRGETQPGALAGHEHFGWLDGVSQPGLRGRLSEAPNDLLTPRQNTADPDQGKPGQDVLWPGEFVFGYAGQTTTDIATKGPDSLAPKGTPVAPAWAANGSYFVFRRLRQDVAAFHEHLLAQSGPGQSPQAVGAKLVGRWPSGAPVLRSPDHDNPDLGRDEGANNHFEFQSATTPSTGTGDQVDDSTWQADSPGDPAGTICPFSSHIRKSYPRDDVASAASPDPYSGLATARGDTATLSEADTQTHRLLRRGIPYGASSTSHPDAPASDAVDRGLLFMAYMTSIEDQFEFVTQQWVNAENFKDPGVGLDPILGQTRPGDGSLANPWVVPTGGGYFFAPSISALEDVLSVP